MEISLLSGLPVFARFGEDIVLRRTGRILVTTAAFTLLFVVGNVGIPASHPAAHLSYAQDPTAPDLVVADVTWSPPNPSIEDTVTFSVRVKNQGSASAGQFRVAYYIDDSYLSSVLVSTLNAGDSVEKTFTWTAQPGSHLIKAVADSNNEITEIDEANNTDTVAFSPTAPDLIIQTITWSPANPSEGDVVDLNILIKNQGTSLAASSFVHLYIDGASRGQIDVARINAGASLTRTYTWVAQSGMHELKAVADSKAQLKENDETNNEKIVTFATAIPDLIVQNIIWSPGSPSKGDDVTFTAAIKNQGTGRADYSHVACYIDGDPRTSAFIDPIEAGATVNQTFTWKAQLGSHDVKIVADSNKWVMESDEDNNERTATVVTISPDLVIEDITWSPAEPSVRDAVTFTVRIKNQGGGHAGPSRLTYYIGDVYSGHTDVEAINAGTSVTKTFTWKAEAGSRKVRAIADYDNDNKEIDETNNAREVVFATLAPDLVVQDITWSPEKPSIGSAVVYRVTIANQGSGRADKFHAAFYIDGSYLTTGYVDSMEAGATDNLTFTATVEAISQDVTAVVDFAETVSESDEDNNEKTVTFYPIAPDLFIRDVTWSPKDAAIGDELTLTATIENRGSDAAAYSLIAYYVDGLSKGYHDVRQIDAGATVTDSFTWTVEAGAHAIAMIADSNETILEGDETNNSRTVNYPPPDLVIQDITWSPLRPSIDETVTITATIKNQGSGLANAYTLSCYVDGVPVGEGEIQEMGSGAAAKPTFTWTALPGSHTVRIMADDANNVVETNETNNEMTASIDTLNPDLAVQEISWTEGDSPTSREVVFTVVIGNLGDGRASASTLACYVDDALVGEQEVQAMAAGARMTGTFSWRARPGSHELKVIADAANAMLEVDEANNEKAVTFTAPAPDLVIKEVTWTEGSSHNSEVTFTVVVENQGDGRAGAFTVTCYASGVLAAELEMEEIGAGTTATGSFTWEGQPGSHGVEVAADSGHDVRESDEDNNSKLLTVSLAATGGNPPTTTATPATPSSSEREVMWGIWIPVILAACAMIGWIAFGLLKFGKKS
jgi:subtilase family serine protease